MSKKERANVGRRSENGSPRNTVAVAHQARGSAGSGFHRHREKDEWAHKDHLFWDIPDETTDEDDAEGDE